MMTRKSIKLARNTMWLEGKIATPDAKLNRWLAITGKSADEFRSLGINAIGFYPSKIVAYYNFSFTDNSVDKTEVLYPTEADKAQIRASMKAGA